MDIKVILSEILTTQIVMIDNIENLEIRVIELEQYTESLERQIKKLKCNEKKYKSVANA